MKNVNSRTDFICILLVCFSAAVGLIPSLNTYAIYLAIPLSSLLLFLKEGYSGSNKYFKTLCVMYLWVAFSSTWATYQDAANRQLHQLVGVILLGYTLTSLSKKLKNIAPLYIVFIISYAAVWYYAQNNILSVISVGVDRLSDDFLNANTLAYYTFYYTFSTFMISQISEGKMKKLSFCLFLFAIPISLYTALLTASRQVLVIQIPLISFLLIAKYMRLNRKSILTLSLLGVLIFAFVTSVGMDMYSGSLLSERNTMTNEDETRFVLLRDAWKVGCAHPLLGVGANNFMYYTSKFNFSHCTYLELFANTGFMGCLIFITVLIKFLKKQLTRYLDSKDTMYIYFFLFGVFFAIDNIFYVFYADLWLMGLYILVLSHSETYYFNKLCKNEN